MWDSKEYPHAGLTERIIGCAVEVHRHRAVACSYLKASKRAVLLILHVHSPTLREGIERLVFKESIR